MRIINGNNIDILKEFPDNYFDAIVTDPPYGLGKEPNAELLMKDWIEKGYHEVGGSGFMGKEWDAFVPQPIFWKEIFRVLKHGGHVLAFYGTRTYDWGVMAMRFAGFEVRDCIQWLYGSGFPKSHNISKAIDKMNGNEAEIIGKNVTDGFLGSKKKRCLKCNKSFFSGNPCKCPKQKYDNEWDGWGSALKPANEPIVLARKPLEKGLSIAENVLKWGVGAINIDGCRVGSESRVQFSGKGTNANVYKEYPQHNSHWQEVNGRFPANLILTHHPECECVGEENIENWNCHEDCPIKILDEQSGESKSSQSMRGEGGGGDKVQQLNYRENSLRGHIDKGGASRFFYVAKASKSERNKGLKGFEEKIIEGRDEGQDKTSIAYKPRPTPMANVHPTVKPIKLMQYLVRLITPPNGIVLDPFCGSGTTGIACKLEGFDFVGLEQDAEYSKIAQARIDNYVDEKQVIKKSNNIKDDNNFKQPTLF